MIVDTGRGEVNVLDIGEGHPVVLLHPLALSGELWRPMAQATPGFRFLAVDAPGHGQTPWNGAPFTVEDMAADAAAVVEGLDLPAAAVLGLSMGGTAAVTLAGSRPDLVSSLVLTDTTACYGDNRVAEWTTRAERAETMPRTEQLSFQIDRWFSERTVADAPDAVQRVCDIFTATDSKAHGAACRALGNADSRPLLSAITAPTLVLVGSEDYATPVDMARELEAGIAGARLEVLDGARHLSVIDDPRAWPMAVEHLRSTT